VAGRDGFEDGLLAVLEKVEEQVGLVVVARATAHLQEHKGVE
jgi:hypothetical protein